MPTMNNPVYSILCLLKDENIFFPFLPHFYHPLIDIVDVHFELVHLHHLLHIVDAVIVECIILHMFVVRIQLKLFPSLISTLTSMAHQSWFDRIHAHIHTHTPEHKVNKQKITFNLSFCWKLIFKILTIAYAIVTIFPSTVFGVKLPYPIKSKYLHFR